MSNKFREFFIIGMVALKSLDEAIKAKRDFERSAGVSQAEPIHVIEYSAYKDLKELSQYKQTILENYMHELSSTKQQLKDAQVELKSTKDSWANVSSNYLDLEDKLEAEIAKNVMLEKEIKTLKSKIEYLETELDINDIVGLENE